VRTFLVALIFLGCAPSPAGPSAARRELALLHVADLHSHLFPDRITLTARDVEYGLGPTSGATVLAGGASRLATVLDEARRRADVSLTLDAGDVLEGTAVYTLFGGVPEMRVVDALDVDADALGNHDFSPGLDRLATLRRHAPRAALLAANLVDEAPGLVAPSLLVERGGMRVRVVGLGRSPDGVPDVPACAAAVQRIIDADRDVDVTVVLSHLGSDLDATLVPLTTGVDVVLGGHTHDVVVPPESVRDCGASLTSERGCRPRPVLVVHSGAYGRYVGNIAVTVSTEPNDVLPGHRSAVIATRSSLVPVTEDIEERVDVLELLEPYRRAMDAAGLEQPLAVAPSAVSRSAVGGGDSPLGNFVTRAMRVAAGADLALINTTGIRDDLAEGELTMEDVFRVLPFDDRLVTVTVSGNELLGAIEQIRSASCARDRVSQVQLDGGTLVLGCDGRGSSTLHVAGRPVDASRSYRVATVSFLTGAGQWLDVTSDGGVDDLGLVRDAVVETVRALAPCVADGGPSLPCLDASAGAVHDDRIVWE
jgi:5'-nucleotidase